MPNDSRPALVRLTLMVERFSAARVALSGARAVWPWPTNCDWLELPAVVATAMVIGVAALPSAVTVSVAGALSLPLLGSAVVPWMVAVGMFDGARPSSY